MSVACRNQAFLFGLRILGLQFHLETTPESLVGFIDNCGDELVEAPWVQRSEDMIRQTDCFAAINRSMEGILDYLAAEIARNLGEQREPMIITQNGEAKFILQGIESYEQTQEILALLKILALGTRQIEEGKVQSATDVIKHIRERRGSR